MILEFEPGDKVINPANKNWGYNIHQFLVQDEEYKNIELEKIETNEWYKNKGNY